MSAAIAFTWNLGIWRQAPSICASAQCAAAREHFQVVRYPTMSADRLVAAASRALGDLNFESNRDDAQATLLQEGADAAQVISALNEGGATRDVKDSEG